MAPAKKASPAEQVPTAGKKAAAKKGASPAPAVASKATKASKPAAKAPAKTATTKAKAAEPATTKAMAAEPAGAKATARMPTARPKTAEPAAAKATKPAPTAPAAPPAKKAPAKKAAAAKADAPAAPAVVVPSGTASEGIGGQGAMWEHFDARFLEAQRKLLLEERVQYTGSAESLQAEARQLTEEYEPGDVQFDDESGEGDSIVVERDRDLALSAQAEQIIVEIDAALSRLVGGSYGVSEVSGLPIPKERLKAIPWTSVRVEEKVGGIGHRR